jgi:hypothetical protein
MGLKGVRKDGTRKSKNDGRTFAGKRMSRIDSVANILTTNESEGDVQPVRKV